MNSDFEMDREYHYFLQSVQERDTYTYPRRMIRNAQDCLVHSIGKAGHILQRVRIKCGLENPYYSQRTGGMHLNQPRPHNNLWHEDALSYSYPVPWSINKRTGHDDNSTSGQTDEFNDGESSRGIDSCDLITPSQSGRQGTRNCTVTKDDGKIVVNVNTFDVEEQRNRSTAEGISSSNPIDVDDDECLVNDCIDLTKVSDEVTHVESATHSLKRMRQSDSDQDLSNTEDNRPPTAKRSRLDYYKGLSCDYCHFVSAPQVGEKEAEAAMKAHFYSAKHNSASLARIENNGRSCRAVSVLSESYLLCFTDKHVALVNSVVPMCPNCLSVHGSIWACAKHYEMIHKEGECDRYALADVAVQKTICFPTANICMTCRATFNSATSLHKHWTKSRHFTASVPDRPGQIALYFCPYCTQLFYNFGGCRMHIIQRHKAHGDAAMRIAFIDPPAVCRRLLPPEQRPTELQARHEMKVVSQMKKGGKAYSVKKKSKKQLRREKKKLYQFIE